MPSGALMELWYTDTEGNMSECAAHMGSGFDVTTWREGYWSEFERDITIKSKDWEYEAESRLILNGGMDGLLEYGQRTMTYDFNSLKGLIFGIRTTDEDKLRIFEVIQRKCSEENRNDFKFYQAYYSHEHGDIRRDEVRPPYRPIGT